MASFNDACLEDLLSNINQQIKIFNDCKMKIYDEENVDYYLDEVAYDRDTDKIFFKVKED